MQIVICILLTLLGNKKRPCKITNLIDNLARAIFIAVPPRFFTHSLKAIIPVTGTPVRFYSPFGFLP
jgi:hypothetical protein